MEDYLKTKSDHFQEKDIFKKALFLQNQGKFKAAIFCYQELLKFCNNWPEVYYNLGFLRERENNFLEAVRCYQQAIKFNPVYSEAYYNLAVIYQQQGLIEDAIKNYEKVIALAPKQIIAYSNLGCLWIKLGEYSQAIEILIQAVTLQPEQAYLHNNLGRAFFANGEIDRAIACYLKALRLQPNLVEIYSNLGEAFYYQKLLESAIQSWQQALQLKPDSVSIHSQCVSALIAQNQYSEAIIHLKKIVALEQPFIKAYSQFTEKLYTENSMDRATIACGKLLKALQQDNLQYDEIKNYLATIYINLGNVLATYHNYPNAEVYYQRSISIQPEYAEVYLAWGDCLAKQWKFNTAALKYHYAFGLHPDNLDFYQKVREVLEKQQQAEEGTLKLSLVKERELFKQLPQNLTLKPEIKCLGLDCQPCLKNLRQHFKPQILGWGIEQYFPPDSLPFQFPNPTVTILPQGRTWIAPKTSWWNICNAIAIFNEQKELIPELSRFYPTPLPGCKNYDWSQHQVFSLQELPPLKIINGRVAVLSGLSGNVYFHWMVDILPRFEILRQNIDLDSIDFFLINSRQQKFQQETLEKLEIHPDKIIESDQISYLQASSLIVPSFPSPVGWTVPSTIQFLRNLFLAATLTQKQYPTRIYISRNRARYRRVLNEPEVIDSLRRFGFSSIEMETLSVQEQTDLFAQAEIIIAPHGAGLTNLIFCKPQTTVVELVSPHYVRHYYWVISQQLGLKHYTLQGQILGCSFLTSLMYPNPLFEDLWIPLKSLERMMQLLGLVTN